MIVDIVAAVLVVLWAAGWWEPPGIGTSYLNLLFGILTILCIVRLLKRWSPCSTQRRK